MRNRAFQDDLIGEVRRICCADTDRARQLKLGEFSTQKEENFSTVNQLMVQIQELKDKVKLIPWMMQKNSMILKLRAALDYPTFPANPWVFRAPDEWLAAILAVSLIHGTHWSISGHVLEGLPARGEPSSAFFENSKNLASSSCRLKPIDTGKIAEQGNGLRKEQQNHTIPPPRFAKKFSTWNPLYRTGEAYPQNCLMENPRNQISDLHFDKFPYSSDFQCWKTNFMTEVCSNSGVPQSQCCGSKKCRWPNQWTIFERRSQLKGVTSLILKCLMRR